ncbi:uncharacterized protein [Periplaneta americana]|uniref:uncharacterized protein n=1 Tax=Periplaneta americana TaxID=6978 RepID=UPI0037E84595
MKWTHALFVLGILAEGEPADKDDDGVDMGDYGIEEDVLPVLADRCFSDVYANLECHFDPNPPPDCEKRDAEDLCSASADALNCARDIIDTAVKPEDGRNDFDAWMDGLESVYNALCVNKFAELKRLINAAACWNSMLFLKCVESGTKIGHVVDLLHSKLDLNRCSHFMISMATCNVRATNRGRSCWIAENIVNEATHAFFTHTKCGQLELCNSTSSTIRTSAWQTSFTLLPAAVYLYRQLT